MDATDLRLVPGFADPVLDGQRVFRAVLEALSRPGAVLEIDRLPTPPVPLDPVTAAIVLALADLETPVWLDAKAATAEVAGHLRFHCGCPIVDEPGDGTFAVIADPLGMPALDAFAQGTEEFPDRSATLVVQVPSIAAGTGWTLAGPGIKGRARLGIGGLPDVFAGWLARNHGTFPLGLDLLFASGSTLAALPRTTRILEG
jgi:alpha-D-ribose 1-methylphosphonate 5-triphosphate synthase subunit PhnH